MVITEQVQRYNARMIKKYNEDVKRWKQENSNNIIPQIAFYLFWNKDGSRAKTGYVVSGDNKAVWAKTAKEARLKYWR